jgi:hypothetical protein
MKKCVLDLAILVVRNGLPIGSWTKGMGFEGKYLNYKYDM